MTLRDEFEALISAPPYERSTERFPDESAWPGQYVVMAVQLGWEMYQAGWNASLQKSIYVVEHYQVSVGNSAAGELAAEWTMDNLKEIRDDLRELMV